MGSGFSKATGIVKGVAPFDYIFLSFNRDRIKPCEAQSYIFSFH